MIATLLSAVAVMCAACSTDLPRQTSAAFAHLERLPIMRIPSESRILGTELIPAGHNPLGTHGPDVLRRFTSQLTLGQVLSFYSSEARQSGWKARHNKEEKTPIVDFWSKGTATCELGWYGPTNLDVPVSDGYLLRLTTKSATSASRL